MRLASVRLSIALVIMIQKCKAGGEAELSGCCGQSEVVDVKVLKDRRAEAATPPKARMTRNKEQGEKGYYCNNPAKARL
jgi:hypothetical protein